jgi:hypothetical protein
MDIMLKIALWGVSLCVVGGPLLAYVLYHITTANENRKMHAELEAERKRKMSKVGL